MKLTVKVPKLGLTTESVTLSEWTKPVGARVERGEIIAVAEADKASIDIEAPMAGRLMQQLAEPGTEMAVGDPLAVFEV
jgi:pyruvate/2-oxoglutarate dehydrogenase complex dihydrolipoamide acyltransferase (E2) component